jgi:hypothetical protein
MADQLTDLLECLARDLEAYRDGLQNILDQDQDVA